MIKLQITNKLVKYCILLAIIALVSIGSTFVSILITSSRTTGIGWGIPIGLVIGYGISSLIQRNSVIRVVIKTLSYSLLVFLVLYFISNYVLNQLELKGLTEIFIYMGVIIFSYETVEVISKISLFSNNNSQM